MRSVRLGLATCLFLAASGCSAPVPTVTGTVTLDGVPLEKGYIAFLPEDSGQGGGADIAAGKYTLRTAAGKYRVEITASKMMPLPRGKVGMLGATEEIRQYIPERFNAKSELKAEVPSTSPIAFELKSK